jgi:hypothetical protein
LSTTFSATDLKRIAADGYAKWDVNATQSVFGKSFVPFDSRKPRAVVEWIE